MNTTNQKLAFEMSWNYAKAGKTVHLSKENGIWSVIIKSN